MEYAEKMYLVPQHQLDKARTENVRETIQQSVENDLDVAMRNILLRTDLNPYEKAKLYTNTLSRFLTIVKQGDRESGVLTQSLPDPTHKDEVPTVASIPFSTVPNQQVRSTIKSLKSKHDTPPHVRPSKRARRHSRSVFPESEDSVFKSPTIDPRQWLEF